MGDSLTRGYRVKRAETWPALLGEGLQVKVINKGINGDTTGGMLARFTSDVVNEKPSHTIIMGGGNDLMWGVPLSVIKANVFAMVHQAYHHLIVPVIGVPVAFAGEMAKIHWPIMDNPDAANEYLSQYRQWILGLAESIQIKTLDFYSLFIDGHNRVKDNLYIDGLHPTVEGNLMMSDLAVKYCGNLT